MKIKKIIISLILIILLIIAFTLISTLSKNTANKNTEVSQHQNDIVSSEIEPAPNTSAYIVTTNKRWLTTQNDGGSHHNEYYEIDFENNTVKKCEDLYKGLEGYVYKDQLIYTKNLSEQESSDLKTLLDRVLKNNADANTPVEKTYVISNSEYSNIRMGNSNDIDTFLNLVSE